ncbi:MAG: BatA domain-containing protein [Chitinophagaceae bacterium]|nr:BatA domain-containing protein [Chitinophagaceae bacterium]
MQFLYPLFFIAGLSLLIPIIIHLFNLRRYKTVLFPHTRFLKSLQLHSRKQSQVRYKWLLAARLLFLLFLIIAFAQPFFASNQNQKAQLTAIYIDNSLSMSLRNGQRTLLDIAKQNAKQLISQNNGPFLILTNASQPSSFLPVSKQQALGIMDAIDFSGNTKTSSQIFTSLQNLIAPENSGAVAFYYLSDFSEKEFQQSKATLPTNISFNGVYIAQQNASNVYIDTAFFEYPYLQLGLPNKLVVKCKYVGNKPKSSSVLTLSVNDQVKAALSPNFTAKGSSIDTISFQVNEPIWQKILLTITDDHMRFDDSFSITARSARDLSVLLLNESQPNLYLRAALGSYTGFKVTEQSLATMPKNLSAYSLIILNGLNTLPQQWADTLRTALEKGQNVMLFVGDKMQTVAMNEGLASIADIRFGAMDTTAQAVAQLQLEHRLLKNIFDKIPDNIQLPFAKTHYKLLAGLGANQQSVFSFRNGDPFLAAYSLYPGQFYICATSIDEKWGNFQSSYFFVPFLYQMASTAKDNQIYALNSGQKEPIEINLSTANNQGQLHLSNANVDVIPLQRAEGMGAKLFLNELNLNSGYYNVHNKQDDTAWIAINSNRSESDLKVWSLADLKKNWDEPNYHWQQLEPQKQILTSEQQSSFSLWKLCAILALLMLGVETYFLSTNLLKQDANTN